MKYIKAKQILLEDRILYDGVLKIDQGRIVDIYEKSKIDCRERSKYIVAPGLVDTHIHGMKGYDVMDATSEALQKISYAAAKVGVTTFLPTTLTASVEDTDKAIENIAMHYQTLKGAKVGGIFLEGPFFVEKYKGAQNPSYFSDPQKDLLQRWVSIARGLPIKIALAPEREGALEFIEFAKSIGVTVALGHSDATYEQAKAAVDRGASIFVHLYNAMSPLHHRNPGMVGAGLTLKDVFAELICDGHHVHPAAAQVVVGMRKPSSTALVTDCMSATNMPDGEYKLGDFDVRLENGTARMKDGNLAGSVLLLKDAIRNVVRWKIADFNEAIQMATIVPAKSVGIDDIAGKIEIGRSADLTIWDEDMEISEIYLDGELFG